MDTFVGQLDRYLACVVRTTGVLLPALTTVMKASSQLPLRLLKSPMFDMIEEIDRGEVCRMLWGRQF